MFLALLFFHLLAVALLFAGMGIEIAATVQLHRATTVGGVRAAMQNGPLIGVFMSTGLVLLLAMGIALVYVGGFGWQPWTTIALILAIVLGINGPVTNGKRGEAIASKAAASPEGPITRELRAARSDRLWNYSVFITALELVAALYVMSNKPGLIQCILAVVLAAALAFVPLSFVSRGERRSEPASAA